MIQGMFDNTALPTLERLTQFTAARHRVLTDNIANLSTPFFKPRDLDPQSFQASLRSAIEQRRQSRAGTSAPLAMRDTDQLTFRDGGLDARPEATNDGILFHDQNNRDVERLMQHLAENTLTHNAAIEMMRNEFRMIETAIRERV